MVGSVNALPSTVGGGGVHADSKLPRLREDDFRLRSALGPIDGADVVDWPLSYADLEPYYAEAERLVGVAGEETNPFAAWRSGPFPMPPGPDMFGAVLSMSASERAGLHPYRAPTGANSEPYDGRPACINCGFCGGFGCPVEAKGDPVALLRRALQTGRCELRPESHVVEVALDGTGRQATGVRYLDADGAPQEVTARYVVLAAGAFETPRLLLRQGIANSSGLIGRNLMYHFQTFAVGAFPFRMHGMRGRTVTGAHDDHIVGDPAQQRSARDAGLPWIRGGLVEHGGAGQPIQEGLVYGPGPHHARSMRDSSLRERLWVFTMQGEDLAQPSNRIDLDPSVRDAWGFPAGRVTYSPHRHELVASGHAGPILEGVFRDAGAEWTVTATSPPQGDDAPENPLGMAPASYHIMGTCRMGADREHQRSRPRRALLGGRQPVVRGLVGVPHIRRLQPDAHAHGPGVSCRASPRRRSRSDRPDRSEEKRDVIVRQTGRSLIAGGRHAHPQARHAARFRLDRRGAPAPQATAGRRVPSLRQVRVRRGGGGPHHRPRP